jgi:DNA polymerase-3 subunit alpha
MGLFGETETSDIALFDLPTTTPATKEQKMLWEKQLLGIYLSEHPLGALKSHVGVDTTSISSFTSELVGQAVRVLGIVTSAKQIMTKSNQAMAFVKIEDSTAATEVIVFPNLLLETKDLWKNDVLLVIDGTVNDKDGSLKLLANKAWDASKATVWTDLALPVLEAAKPRRNGQRPPQIVSAKESSSSTTNKTPNNFTVALPTGSTKTLLAELKQLLTQFPGPTKVVLRIPQNGSYHEIETSLAVQSSPQLLSSLDQLLGNVPADLNDAPSAATP